MIVLWYSLTNARKESDTKTFYKELSSFAQHIPKHNAPIIGEDMNAQICKDGNNKFCLHNLPNKNGEYLADITGPHLPTVIWKINIR